MSEGADFLLADYARQIAPTDRFGADDLTPVLLGLFGEVGSVMSTSKKLHREREAFTGYRRDVEEEFGDTLWYVAALCRRLDIDLSNLFERALGQANVRTALAAGSNPHFPISRVVTVEDIGPLDNVLLRLGESAAKLLHLRDDRSAAEELLVDFARTYIEAIRAAGISFATVLQVNLAKARGRFIEPVPETLPDFDADFPAEERLPQNFEIEITQRADGRSYLRWNGVFIGDPLTDNIADRDGFRFHDVFHFAHAAVLHWSPTFRALIKHKRKSKPAVDEAQDGGRAIVIEEGLTAYIFSCAKDLDFFSGRQTISFDLLKTISNFVRGYEVERCPLKLWESAILQGYEVFRKVKDNNGGIIVGDRRARTLQYRPVKRGDEL